MNTIPDEQVLRERLHRDLDAVPAAPAPVRAVIQRGAARRGRRRARGQVMTGLGPLRSTRGGGLSSAV